MDYVKAPVEFTIFVLENLIHERVERTFMLRFSAHVNSQIYYEPKKKFEFNLFHPHEISIQNVFR